MLRVTRSECMISPRRAWQGGAVPSAESLPAHLPHFQVMRAPRLRVLLAAVALVGSSCSKPLPAPTGPATRPPTRYLFAWAGDEDREESDFLAVIDLARDGDRYGTVVATLPVGERALWPHHTEHLLGASRTLFANGYASNRNFVFDLRDPLRPRVETRFSGAPGSGLSFLHSFERLPSGHMLATFQAHGAGNVSPGGLAELDAHGRVVRWRSAADASADQGTLRPYGLAAVPALDRVVVALTYMPIPTWHALRPSIAHDHAGNQIQIYRLSDLALIKTIRLATNDAPNEPRVLQDGRTVLVGTSSCRLYRMQGLEGTNPGVEMIHAVEARGCALPVVMGDFWVQASAEDHRVFSLDIHDLERVRTVSSVSFDERQRPHWLATDGHRIVVVNEPSSSAERRMWMLQLNRANGRLTLDADFRDAGSSRPGVAFDRADWPHGRTGNAVPHGTVFGW
jgi:hypothetical protein